MTWFTRLGRIVFVTALVFAVTMAVLPHPPQTALDQFGDKVEHMLAFATLATLAALAYPREPLARIGERLSFVGALIEVVQSLPALHRDCDIGDWIADTTAIVIALLVIKAIRTARRPSAT